MNNSVVYIMTNGYNGVLYIGVTTNLAKRVLQHKSLLCKGFASKYKCTRLVYYEYCSSPTAAILREKQLKNGPRIKKIKLIETLNPYWKDLG